MQAYFAAPQPVTDPSWYPNSSATHHITSDLANLNMRAEEYIGLGQIKMGNGTGLDIKHIGQTKILTPTTYFPLHDVLHVPLIKKNLLSVHKFTKDTNTYLEFHPSCFFVKDRATGKVLVQGLSNHGLYSFSSSLFRCCGPSSHPVSPAFVNERATLTQWYSRLRHAALRVVSNVVSKFGLLVFANKMDNSCPTCLSSKSHRLVFPLSTSRVTAPLELIYTDVWGLSPFCSSTGNKYYVSFMDSFSRYTWFYPMSCKSDVSSIFLKFQKYVERYFNLKIKTIQSDWGGGYRSLHQILQSNGISHRLSCPHTPQQIGVIKRKHHHLVETGLALMSHAGVPLKFWDDAFQTACYLINRMPTPLLQKSYPYETLFFPLLITLSYGFLVVNVGLIFVLILLINFNLVLFLVFF